MEKLQPGFYFKLGRVFPPVVERELVPERSLRWTCRNVEDQPSYRNDRF